MFFHTLAYGMGHEPIVRLTSRSKQVRHLELTQLLAASFTLVACSGGDSPGPGGGTPPPPPAPPPPAAAITVSISPEAWSLFTGLSVVLTARAHDASRNTYTSLPLEADSDRRPDRPQPQTRNLTSFNKAGWGCDLAPYCIALHWPVPYARAPRRRSSRPEG